MQRHQIFLARGWHAKYNGQTIALSYLGFAEQEGMISLPFGAAKGFAPMS
jgi:hypothetical protein